MHRFYWKLIVFYRDSFTKHFPFRIARLLRGVIPNKSRPLYDFWTSKFTREMLEYVIYLRVRRGCSHRKVSLEFEAKYPEFCRLNQIISEDQYDGRELCRLAEDIIRIDLDDLLNKEG